LSTRSEHEHKATTQSHKANIEPRSILKGPYEAHATG
jgi:hypothetical protein